MCLVLERCGPTAHSPFAEFLQIGDVFVGPLDALASVLPITKNRAHIV
jgi:hypothetical protein